MNCAVVMRKRTRGVTFYKVAKACERGKKLGIHRQPCSVMATIRKFRTVGKRAKHGTVGAQTTLGPTCPFRLTPPRRI